MLSLAVLSGCGTINNDPTFPPRESNAFLIVAIESIASGVADTLVLPYMIYRQNKHGSIQIYR
jgi:uncharacterized protein YceK